LQVFHDGERTFTVKAIRDDRTKELGVFTIQGLQIYRGVFVDGKAYTPGDTVTWGGSLWHCNQPTGSKPGEQSKAWTLCVKRGQDGKDGKDAPGGLPVVKVGARE
jgi:integrin beta 3